MADVDFCFVHLAEGGEIADVYHNIRGPGRDPRDRKTVTLSDVLTDDELTTLATIKQKLSDY